ncbi:MAG: efflux RND transporter periplasmic adaptor subunit [Sphingomonadaceae bacterium]
MEPSHRITRRGWLLAATVALAIGLFIWFLVWRTAQPGGAVDADGPPVVTVVVPGRQPVADTVVAHGSIAARRDMPVGVQGEGGQVVAIRAESGQMVKAGQVLADLDSAVERAQLAQLRAAVAQAQADARLAQAELDRASQLVSRGFISRADIDRRTAARDAARARVEVAKAQVREMQERIARLSIRAPEAGLVLSRHVEPGQIVSPATGALFHVAARGEMELRAQVAEQDMPRLRVGQEAVVTPTGSGQNHTGRVWLLEPLIDRESRQGVARILLPAAPELRAGGFADVTLPGLATPLPVVPRSAVLADAVASYVLLVGEKNVVTRRNVTTGRIGKEGVAITSGLDGSEQVVVRAGAFLRPGETVKPVREGGN